MSISSNRCCNFKKSTRRLFEGVYNVEDASNLGHQVIQATSESDEPDVGTSLCCKSAFDFIILAVCEMIERTFTAS